MTMEPIWATECNMNGAQQKNKGSQLKQQGEK